MQGVTFVKVESERHEGCCVNDGVILFHNDGLSDEPYFVGGTGYYSKREEDLMFWTDVVRRSYIDPDSLLEGLYAPTEEWCSAGNHDGLTVTGIMYVALS
jgi:hypothetical protein